MQLGGLSLDADVSLAAPWTVLYGPSGSGKSTILRAACGLLPSARVALTRFTAGQAITLQDDRSSIPPHQRGIRYAPQHTSLFPHLSVADNIAFSVAATGQTKTFAAQALIQASIDLLRLEPLLKRFPSDLSGGERQRVSLARALASPDCKLLLLDEPFNGIDRVLRDAILPSMRTSLQERKVPVLSVTHDIEEVFLLNPDVVLLRDGNIEARGPVDEALAPERARILDNLNSIG